jgi:hypothetical protein
VADETDAVLPVASDEVAAPATWTARNPDAAWCPEALAALLDPAFVATAAHEPATLALAARDWLVRGATVRGRSHGHRGEYRDDALAGAAREGLVVLAVADGAGSSALSRIGAAVTARLAVDRTIARFASDTATADATSRLGTAMAHAVHDAAMRLHELATAGEVSPTSLRTTLILVAIAGETMLMSQVGDGAVLIRKTDGSVLRVGAQRETAWAGEVTCFVPDACAMTQAAALRQLRASDVSLIALMTDGVDDPFHPLEQSGAALVTQWIEGTSGPVGTARQPALGPVLDDPQALVNWLSFEQRGEVDDRTLLLAWRPTALRADVVPA